MKPRLMKFYYVPSIADPTHCVGVVDMTDGAPGVMMYNTWRVRFVRWLMERWIPRKAPGEP